MFKTVIILIEPQMGENIGAAARVMSNFDIDELRIVTPRDGWPNDKATAMAAHGSHIIENAKIYATLEDAIKDLTYVFSTSAAVRSMNKPLISSSELIEHVQTKLNERIGVMFGRERTGLYNEEIILSDCMIQIPVSKNNSSLNLAQAVAIICYEFSKMHGLNINQKPTVNSLASKEDLVYFFQFLENELLKTGFLRNEEMFLSMQQNIRNMFVRTGLTDQDLRTLHGIFRSFIK